MPFTRSPSIRQVMGLVCLGGILILCLIVSMALGAADISPPIVWQALVHYGLNKVAS